MSSLRFAALTISHNRQFGTQVIDGFPLRLSCHFTRCSHFFIIQLEQTEHTSFDYVWERHAQAKTWY
jgi:hypothetical protein